MMRSHANKVQESHVHPKVTVIIPTRDRADTLRYALSTAVRQTYDNLEIIVSDNASRDETRDVVMSFDDPRITYLNTGRSLSMADNYEFALDHVDQGWVVMIGDDDGLLPNSLEEPVRQLEQSGLQALASRQCSYTWPGAARQGGTRLSVPLGQRYRRMKAGAALRSAARMHHHGYVMPQVYTGGLVAASLIKFIKARTGRFYRAQIPDYYSGFAICSVVDEFLLSEKPFAIAGRSSHSVGAALFAQQKDRFLDDQLIPFDDSFPLPPSGTLMFSMPAITMECYLKTVDLHGNPLRLRKQEILTLILSETPQNRDEIEAWGGLYAAKHRLNFDAARARAKRRNIARSISRVRSQAHNFLTRFRLPMGEGDFIRNVDEAATAAQAILFARPGRAANCLKSLARVSRADVAAWR